MKKMKNKNFGRVLKKIFFENTKIKIICFLLALFTYLLIGYFQRSEKIFFCKLNVTGLKEKFVISNNIPSTIKIVINDKEKTLNKITENDFNVTLDLSSIEKPDTYYLNLKYSIPKQIQSFFATIDVIPDRLKVNIEKLTEKSIPISVNYTGTPETGFILKNITITPKDGRIQGAEKILSKIDHIETEKISINGEKQSFKRELNLISPEDGIKIIGHNKVEVFFEIVGNN